MSEATPRRISSSSAAVGKNDLEPFLDKEYRDAYIDGYVKGSIAYQIHALREQSGLSQGKFGEQIGKPQSVVSRLESAEYGAVTINTLLDIAKARDVGLKVSFVDYATVLANDVSPAAMKVESIYETYNNCSDLTITTSHGWRLAARRAVAEEETENRPTRPVRDERGGDGE